MGPNIFIRAGAAKARAIGGAVDIKVQTRLLFHWAEIAIENERRAPEARSQLITEADEALADGRGLAIDRELRPAMIAIAAAAHSLDALYGEIRDLALPAELVASWSRTEGRRTPRPARINESLKHGCRIRADRWGTKLTKLFELRDQAVHPETGFRKTALHPLGVNVAREYTIYCCEEASEAVDLLLDVLSTLVEKPKPVLREFALGIKPSCAALKDKRYVRRPMR